MPWVFGSPIDGHVIVNVEPLFNVLSTEIVAPSRWANFDVTYSPKPVPADSLVR